MSKIYIVKTNRTLIFNDIAFLTRQDAITAIQQCIKLLYGDSFRLIPEDSKLLYPCYKCNECHMSINDANKDIDNTIADSSYNREDCWMSAAYYGKNWRYFDIIELKTVCGTPEDIYYKLMLEEQKHMQIAASLSATGMYDKKHI